MNISSRHMLLWTIAIVALAVPALASGQSVAISIYPTSLTMNIGDTQTVSVTGAGNYYLGTNSNPNVAGATLTGSTISVTAFAAGSDSVSICTRSSSSLTCTAFSVTVRQPLTPIQNTNPQSSATISFAQTQLTVDVWGEQTTTISGTGSGSYYISANSDPSIVYAGVSGNVLTVRGIRVGGANITVCQNGGACGNVYAYVPLTAANQQAQASPASAGGAPGLTAFYIASNGANGGFLGSGAVLTVKFNTSADVVNPSLTVAGRQVALTGTSSGPYAGTYTMSGSEASPLPVAISFATAAGLSGSAYFSVGQPAASPSASAQGSVSSAAHGAFTAYLTQGSTGAQVTALQALLKQIGVYSGPVTGNYGPLTEAAVRKYQTLRGISALGIVGPSTRAALNRE